MKILKLRTKGQTELSEFMLKLIATMLFTVFLIGGILAISQFKVQVNENSGKRLAIDFGENILAAPCLAEEKGLFNETMLNSELSYSSAHPEDKDGISCLETSVITAFKIKTGNKDWFFGDENWQYLDNIKISELQFVFPSVLNISSGEIVPAKLFVVVSATSSCNNKNEGFNCYNCLDEEKCNKQGCRWDTGICKP